MAIEMISLFILNNYYSCKVKILKNQTVLIDYNTFNMNAVSI